LKRQIVWNVLSQSARKSSLACLISNGIWRLTFAARNSFVMVVGRISRGRTRCRDTVGNAGSWTVDSEPR
jgi:hypothetical protein